jgi:hypothetical protein
MSLCTRKRITFAGVTFEATAYRSGSVRLPKHIVARIARSGRCVIVCEGVPYRISPAAGEKTVLSDAIDDRSFSARLLTFAVRQTDATPEGLLDLATALLARVHEAHKAENALLVESWRRGKEAMRRELAELRRPQMGGMKTTRDVFQRRGFLIAVAGLEPATSRL